MLYSIYAVIIENTLARKGFFKIIIFKQMKILTKYLRDSKEELSKVSWPSKEQTVNSTILVVAVSIAIAAFLGSIDYGMSRLLEYLLINF